MKMLGWILGIILKEQKRNDDICHAIGVACITDKIGEAKLRWYRHVQWRDGEHCVKHILKAEVHGSWSRGNTISQDPITLILYQWMQGTGMSGEEPMWLSR